MRLAPVVLVVVFGAACSRPSAPPAPRLAVPSDDDARAFVERFFTDYVAGDVEAALSRLCEQDAPSRNAYRAFIEGSQGEGSRFRITRFQARDVQAAWKGAEPYFEVVVAFPRTRGPGEIVHAYRVRAREGCIEHFLGGPVPRHSLPPAEAPPALGLPPSPETPPAPEEEPSLPRAPVGADDEVIEL